MTSSNNPLSQAVDQAPAGLDDLLASVLSGEDEQPKKRGRKKKEPPAKDFKAVLWASPDKRHIRKTPDLVFLPVHLDYLRTGERSSDCYRLQ